ncbi:hypothetical protein BJX61DRAFT_532250 [Aspergillus egyptiacus]|nr:hypothetical protein BJX61DRAFT_532250 [Aspergillus egyptiacus]
MRRPSFNPGRSKNILHAFQGFIIFLGWAMTIAIFTKGGGIDGRTGWYFGLCWLSIPALIYLVAVPMWPRARRFGNVYAFATVDCLFALLWFTAWVCLASYVAQGKSEGKEEGDQQDNQNEEEKSGCDNWKYGSATKCKISTATTVLGVAIFVLFCVTAWMSFRNVMHFRRTGTLPDAVSDPTFAAQSKAAFSSNPGQDFEDEDDFRSGRVGMGSSLRDRDEDYALLHQSEADDLGNPGGRSAMHGSYDPTSTASIIHDYNASEFSTTSYGGAHGQHYGGPSESGVEHDGDKSKTKQQPKMAQQIDLFNQHPLSLDPTTKAISLAASASTSTHYTPALTTALTTELTTLNALHRSLLSLDAPQIPPPPVPQHPAVLKRSAQIAKLRDSANAAYRKNNHAEAVRLYTYAIEMALTRPPWEPVGVIREELAALYSNRAQAWMSQQGWVEGMLDARASVEAKQIGNVKAWYRGGKCMVEMGRWEEARRFVNRGLEVEGKNSEAGKELLGLLEEVEEGVKRSEA